MTALSLHRRVVALLSQEPSRPSGMVCVRGVAWHDEATVIQALLDEVER